MGRRAGVMLATLAAIFLAQLDVTHVHATDRPELRVRAGAIAHGAEISAANAGVSALGFAPETSVEGGEIKDGKLPHYATRVAGPAIYDGYEVMEPHLLISNVIINSPLDISVNAPVVLRGVIVRVAGGQPWTILVRPGAGPLYILWSDLGGSPDGGKPPASAIDIRSSGVVVHRSHLSGTADGMSISGRDVSVTETLIDGLATFPGSHNDAIQLAATARNVTIARSKILNRLPQTSCLYLLGRSITLQSNYVAGGGWTIYGGGSNNGKGGEGASKVAVKDTIFGRDYFPKSGGFGPVTYWSDVNDWQGNRFSDGAMVEPR